MSTGTSNVSPKFVLNWYGKNAMVIQFLFLVVKEMGTGYNWERGGGGVSLEGGLKSGVMVMMQMKELVKYIFIQYICIRTFNKVIINSTNF